MRAFQLPKPKDIQQAPLQAVQRPKPIPGSGQLLIYTQLRGTSSPRHIPLFPGIRWWGM